jgi:hypothetical protein
MLPVGNPVMMCKACCGNGEIVTDWDRSLEPHDGDVGDEAVAECPVCNGKGMIDGPVRWGDGEVDSVCEPCPECTKEIV